MAKLLDIGEYSGTKLKENVQDNFVCSVTTYNAANFDSSRHYHPNTHLSFVFKGGCEEVKKDAYHRKPFSTTFYHPGEHHQINHIKDQSIHVNIEFEDRFFDVFCKEETIATACKTNIALPTVMTKIFQELCNPDDLSANAVEGLVLTLFDKQDRSLKHRNIPTWVYLVKDFIHENWAATLSLDNLAILCNVHKITISKYFAKYTGYTISEYQRYIRMKHAMVLVHDQKHSLTEIALKCGFADQSHFIRCFKSQLGYLPKQFEKLLR